jgi:hypothetical protein
MEEITDKEHPKTGMQQLDMFRDLPDGCNDELRRPVYELEKAKSEDTVSEQAHRGFKGGPER